MLHRAPSSSLGQAWSLADSLVISRVDVPECCMLIQQHKASKSFCFNAFQFLLSYYEEQGKGSLNTCPAAAQSGKPVGLGSLTCPHFMSVIKDC